MTGEHKICLRPLRERPVGLENDAESEARLARLTPHLNHYAQRLKQARAKRRARIRIGGWLGSAALLAGIGSISLRDQATTPQSTTVLVSGEFVHENATGKQLMSVDGFPVSATGTLSTLEKPARVVTPQGLEISLGPGSNAALDGIIERSGESQLRLNAGSLRCKVPPLGEHRRFSVVTPDARVVVHGTEFSVELLPVPGQAARTCVRVTQGLVGVERDGQRALLGAGHALGCDAPALADEPAPAAAPVAPATPPSSSKSAVGTLPQETHLLKSALVAERSGNPARAQQLLRRLISKYPHSPLQAEARATLARLEAAASSQAR